MSPWITACLLTWQTALALIAPLYAALPNFMRGPNRANALTVAIYFSGMLLVLLFFAAFTPRRWWIQPTLLGVIAILGGSIVAGGGLLTSGQHIAPAWFGNTIAVAPTSKPGVAVNEVGNTAQPPALQPGADYRVRHPLNLRSAPGVNGKLLAVLPADAVVTSTGVRNGDWWQVKADKHEGWLSSLWLTRISPS